MPIRFRWRETPVAIKNAKHADPQKIGEALSKISRENGGRLTRPLALNAARDRRSPMHRHIEWADKIAAEKYRLEQVGELIRLIVRDDPDDETLVPHRAFLSINDGETTSYRNVDEVLGSASLQLAVMQRALRDLRAWEARYSEIIEICDLVRTARERLEARVRQQETRPQ